MRENNTLRLLLLIGVTGLLILSAGCRRESAPVHPEPAAFKVYRFDVYAKVCYDFFWRDFCDWYVEATKPAMKDPARAGQTANILAAVLDGALRLMHPVIPFITETLWWKLNEVRPKRELPGRIASGKSARLIRAPWPTVGSFSEAAEHIFPKMQEIVGAIRTARNDHKVDPKKPVEVSILACGDEPARLLLENREMLELLAICTLKSVATDLAGPADSVRITAAGNDIFIAGLINADAEEERSGKRLEGLTKNIAALRGRLNNPGYMAKAPPALVQQTNDQLAEAEAELAKLGG